MFYYDEYVCTQAEFQTKTDRNVSFLKGYETGEVNQAPEFRNQIIIKKVLHFWLEVYFCLFTFQRNKNNISSYEL